METAPTTPRWKVVYDHQFYAVYVLIHDDHRDDETHDEQAAVLAWAKQSPRLVGLGDSPFMVVEVPNGVIKGIGEGWDLRAVIPIQGSGGPMPKPEQWVKIKAWRAAHKAAGEALGIEFAQKCPDSEYGRNLGWLSSLMKRYNVYC